MFVSHNVSNTTKYHPPTKPSNKNLQTRQNLKKR